MELAPGSRHRLVGFLDSPDHGLHAFAQLQGGLHLVWILEVVVLEDLELAAGSAVAEHAEVLVLLYLDVLEGPMHHHLLFRMEQLHAPWHLGEDESQHEAQEEDHVLEIDEQRELLRERPRLVLVRGEDEQHDICRRRQNTVDVEGCGPGLIVPGTHRYWPLPVFYEARHIHIDLKEHPDEVRRTDPGSSNGEECGVAVCDKDLGEVGTLIVGHPLRLLLRLGQVSELEALVPVEEGCEEALVVVATSVPQCKLGVQVLNEVRQGEAEKYEDRKLRLQVDEAIPMQAVHLLPKEVLVLLEEGDVVEHKERVYELPHHDLVQHVLIVLGLSPVVLKLGQPTRHFGEERIHDLHEDGDKELKEKDAAGEVASHAMPEEHDQEKAAYQHHGGDEKGCSAEHVVPDALLPRVVRLHLRGYRVDARLAEILRAARLQGRLQVQGAPAERILGLLAPPEVGHVGGPDAHEDAEEDRCHVVRRVSAEVDKREDEADHRQRHQPLPIEAQEKEIEGYLAPEVITHLVRMVFVHDEPLQLAGLAELGQSLVIVEWEVAHQLVLVQQVANGDPRTILVLGGDDVVDQRDLVDCLEDRVGVGEIVLCVRLVDMRDDSPVLVLALGPAWEVLAVFRISIKELLLQL
mmetsp:Transcript_84610/g.171572  ORF Transcript_84610/g.171572 Transcript_84610/m.171572 type:complete len:634 (+) Transcript_84610:2-1903(+)